MPLLEIEIIINNCLPNIPSDNPFSPLFVLRKTGEAAYRGLAFPGLMTNSAEEKKTVENIEIYLLSRKLAVRTDHQVLSLQLNEEGRRLLRINDIREYERYVWWDKNWGKAIGIIGGLIALITLILKIFGHS